MTQAQIDKFLYEECETFDDTMTLETYTKTICKYLTLCSWQYTMAQAKAKVKQYAGIIKEAYNNKETVGDIAMDIGYSCG
ncbi:MAG: hypothetical protein LUF89_01475 [Ruminococcus sp.]|nr:hypothetical protein [Ruminococcus sp.]